MNKNLFKEGCIKTDTTRINGMIIDDILKVLSEDVNFIFGNLI